MAPQPVQQMQQVQLQQLPNGTLVDQYGNVFGRNNFGQLVQIGNMGQMQQQMQSMPMQQFVSNNQPVQNFQGNNWNNGSVQANNQRFGGNNRQQPLTQLTHSEHNTQQFSGGDNRFNTSKNTNQGAEMATNTNEVQVTTQEVNLNFVNTDFSLLKDTSYKVTKKNITHSLTVSHNDEVVSTDTLESLIEYTVKNYYNNLTEANKTYVYVQKGLVSNKVYGCTNKQLNEVLFNDSAKTVYRTMSSKDTLDLKSKQDLVYVSMFNNIMTNIINEYLYVTKGNGLRIDSFVDDFNNLLKHLRDTEAFMEDDLLDFLTEYINDIKGDKVTLEEESKFLTIPVRTTIVYVNLLSEELNIFDSDSNKKYLFESVANIVDDLTFYIVTADNVIHKCFCKDDDDIVLL